MLRQTRLLLGALISCGCTLLPFLSAEAQDAITSEAYAQMNQVQQALSSGLISSAQADDLMTRYNDILLKDQQWSQQDGGSLNVPDRLDLNGKLKRVNKRMSSILRDNGYTSTTGGILPGIFTNTNGNLNNGLNGYLNNGLNGYLNNGLNGYLNNGLNTCRNNAYLPYGNYGYGLNNNLLSAPANSGYSLYPAGYTGNYSGLTPSSLLNSGLTPSNLLNSGIVQGLLNRWIGN